MANKVNHRCGAARVKFVDKTGKSLANTKVNFELYFKKRRGNYEDLC